MKNKVLVWWHKQRGFHAAPLTCVESGKFQQVCTCGAIKDGEPYVIRPNKSILEYEYFWAA